MSNDLPIDQTPEFKQAVEEAYERGKRDALVQEIHDDLADHLKDCKHRNDRVWNKLEVHSRLIYIGFGIITVLELLVLAAGPLAGFFTK